MISRRPGVVALPGREHAVESAERGGIVDAAYGDRMFFDVGRRIGWRIRAKKRRHRLAVRKERTRDPARERRRKGRT